MNLEKLFEAQRILRNKIGYKNHDRFEKITLALIVEAGECANEWRGFKFWSKDQEARTEDHILKEEYKHLHITQTGAYEYQLRDEFGIVAFNDVTDHFFNKKNPLLEEFVDMLHFALELGIELEEVLNEYVKDCFVGIENQFAFQKKKTITEQFILVSTLAGQMVEDDYYCELFAAILNLGDMLGFTPEEIEDAYYEKNQINHERQKAGY